MPLDEQRPPTEEEVKTLVDQYYFLGRKEQALWIVTKYFVFIKYILEKKLLTATQILNSEGKSTELFFSVNGIIALEEKLITFQQAENILPGSLALLLSNNGLAALREKLVNPECFFGYSEFNNTRCKLPTADDNIEKHQYLLTDKGLHALRNKLTNTAHATSLDLDVLKILYPDKEKISTPQSESNSIENIDRHSSLIKTEKSSHFLIKNENELGKVTNNIIPFEKSKQQKVIEKIKNSDYYAKDKKAADNLAKNLIKGTNILIQDAQHTNKFNIFQVHCEFSAKFNYSKEQTEKQIKKAKKTPVFITVNAAGELKISKGSLEEYLEEDLLDSLNLISNHKQYLNNVSYK